MGYKPQKNVATLSEAVSFAFDELQDLCSEVGDWYDNLPPGLVETDKANTLNEIRETLEALEQPDMPDIVSAIEVEYVILLNTDKRRPRSRQVRFDDACGALRACVEAVTCWADETLGATPEMKDEARGYADELETEVQHADGCEFPGLF